MASLLVEGVRGSWRDFRLSTGSSLQTAPAQATPLRIGHVEVSEHWSASRQKVGRMVSSSMFFSAMALIILSGVILSVKEADLQAREERNPLWLDCAQFASLAIFAMELAARFYVLRLEFFVHALNVVDLLVVSVDVVAQSVALFLRDSERPPSFSILRIFRLLHFLRASQYLMHFPKIFVMMESFASAMKACAWAMVLIMIILVLWSIASVNFLSPISKDLTRDGIDDAFATVWRSCLTHWQTVVVGDNWGGIAMPIIDHSPWTFFLFAAILATVNLGLMNLVLAVIVDAANAAKEADVEARAQENRERMLAGKERLYKLCKDLDVDGNGQLTLPELQKGVSDSPEFANILRVMDIGDNEISVVFQILDTDGSGDIDYEEFTEQLYKMKTQEEHTVLAIVKHVMLQVKDDIKEELVMIKEESQMLTLEMRELRCVKDAIGELSAKFDEFQHLMKGERCLHATMSSDAGNAQPVSVCEEHFLKLSSVSELAVEEPIHKLEKVFRDLQQHIHVELEANMNEVSQELRRHLAKMVKLSETEVTEAATLVSVPDGRSQFYSGLPATSQPNIFDSCPHVGSDSCNSHEEVRSLPTALPSPPRNLEILQL